MKIECVCGALIVDQTDDLLHKGYVLPDQARQALWEALDAEVIDPLAARRTSADAAARRARELVNRPARPAWQCRACGRLYLADPAGRLHRYAPEAGASAEILRGR